MGSRAPAHASEVYLKGQRGRTRIIRGRDTVAAEYYFGGAGKLRHPLLVGECPQEHDGCCRKFNAGIAPCACAVRPAPHTCAVCGDGHPRGAAPSSGP